VFENALLSVEQAYKADAKAAEKGVPSLDLMEAAGDSIAIQIRQRWSERPIVVLCGPGNNGGDGFVVARRLANSRWPVRVALLGARGSLKGDAAANAGRWEGDVEDLDLDTLDGCEMVVDALFGAGLARPLEGVARDVVEDINRREIPCISIDVPSGVNGDTGEVLGAAPRAMLTVTFFRRKPGHLLMPGRGLAGEVVVADIGIPEDVLKDIAPRTYANGPGLWREIFPWPRADANKYSRGHAVIAGGAEMTGAARLAAQGCRRIGAGLVTLAVPPAVFSIYAQGAPGTLVAPVQGPAQFAKFIADERKNALLAGPGLGLGKATREIALLALGSGKATVLDADAISVFGDNPAELFEAIKGPCLLTPHEGEFRRVFDVDGDKVTRARAAAALSGAVVLLKGPDTVIAAPDGRSVINDNAPPTLATAGSGDVLAGMALGLVAQGMDVFDAAAAAAWLHGACAAVVGPGLIAEDIPDRVPQILGTLI